MRETAGRIAGRTEAAPDVIDAVQRMQDCIEDHLAEPITLEQLASAAGYSPWHASRVFRQQVGMAPFEYLRARRLSMAALRLRDHPGRVLDVALDSAFGSHEGFTRAFSRQFGMNPAEYSKRTPPVRLFLPSSVRDAYLFLTKGAKAATHIDLPRTRVIFTQAIGRPARKLIVKRGRRATEYFAYCEEMGCEVWDVLSSIAGTTHEPMGMWLPESLRAPRTSTYVQGVEVPADYDGPVPEGMELVDLPPCTMIVFHGQPYPDEGFRSAIDEVWAAIDAYRPEHCGWQWADDDAPRCQLEPRGERGYIEARPVVALS